MQGKSSRSFGELLVLLLQFIEQRTGKELTKRDIKTITELFNGGDGHTLTGWIEHTIYRRWCYTGTGRQLVGMYLPLVVELFKAFGDGIFYSRDEVYLTMMLQKSVQLCIRICV